MLPSSDSSVELIASIARVAERSALQFAALFGALALGCGALALLAKWAGNLHRQFAWPKLPLYLFGVVGVPAHELSHAAFCVLFGHRVNRVKWFDPAGHGGSQGAVEHSYEPSNPRHRIGQFFIGAAPALLGPIFVALLFYWLAPSLRSADLGALFGPGTHWTTAPAALARALISPSNWARGSFWFFIYLAAAICSQIELSRSDLAQAKTGVVACALAVVALNALASALGALWGSGWGAAWHDRAMSALDSAARVWASVAGLAIVASAATLLLTWALMSLVHVALRRPPPNPFRG